MSSRLTFVYLRRRRQCHLQRRLVLIIIIIIIVIVIFFTTVIFIIIVTDAVAVSVNSVGAVIGIEFNPITVCTSGVWEAGVGRNLNLGDVVVGKEEDDDDDMRISGLTNHGLG